MKLKKLLELYPAIEEKLTSFAVNPVSVLCGYFKSVAEGVAGCNIFRMDYQSTGAIIPTMVSEIITVNCPDCYGEMGRLLSGTVGKRYVTTYRCDKCGIEVTVEIPHDAISVKFFDKGK